MTIRYRRFFVILLFPVIGFLSFSPEPTCAGENLGPPSPAGFANPSDLGGLLAYRLPDWGYRTWQLGFDFNGAKDNYRHRRAVGLNLTSDFRLYRESEKRVTDFGCQVQGKFNESRQTGDYSVFQQNMDFLTGLDYATRRYLWRDLALGARLAGNAGYQEAQSIHADAERLNIGRKYEYILGLDGVWGRLRNVTPLLRAQRISERLVAMGRPALAEPQVQDLAAIIAQHSGYLMVFDRSDKYFWGEVLADLAKDEPLTPFEVLYLAEVLAENLGERREGWQTSAGILYQQFEDDLGSSRPPSRGSYEKREYLSLKMAGSWFRNLSLAHQISADVYGGWSFPESSFRPSFNTENFYLRATLRHLWVVADRFLWENMISGALLRSLCSDSDAPENFSCFDRESGDLNLLSSFDFFLEDAMTLTPFFKLRIDTNDSDRSDYRERVAYSYGVQLTYWLDGMLY